MGALAVWERRPDLTESIIEKALATNPRAMRSYAPDGVYPEGFGYWAYGTWYEVLMIESLRSALGGSAGLERAEGFLASADFMNFMVATSGVCYNFSDSPAANAINPLLYWFAAETGNSNLVRHDRERTVANGDRLRIESPRMLPFAMLFASRCDFGKAAPDNARFWKRTRRHAVIHLSRRGHLSRSERRVRRATPTPTWTEGRSSTNGAEYAGRQTSAHRTTIRSKAGA